jgi:hypothetical protein
MPQFDLYSFAGQVFWLLISFFFLYFFISYYYLLNFSQLFKMRKKLKFLLDNTQESVIRLYYRFINKLF